MCKLKDFAYYVTDKISATELNSKKYISIDNMLINKAGVTTSEYVPLEGNVTRFKVGDILLGNIRPYFKKIWLAGFNGGCSPDVLCIRSNGKVSAEFLYSLLSQDVFFDYDMAGAKGSKMPRGDKNHIMNFPVPNISSKEEIGKFIVSIDNKIQNNNKINTELEAMAKIIYDYWFLQFEFPNEEGKPYKSSGCKMVWNDELGQEIPEGWYTVKVYEILSKVNNSNKLSSSEYKARGKYPIVDQSAKIICGYTDDDNGKIDFKNCIIFGDHTKIVKYIDFDFVRGADGTQVINSNNNSLPNYILYNQIKNMSLVSQGYSRYFKFLKDKYVLIPSKTIADKYMKIIEKPLNMIKKNTFENLKLTNIRDYLLPLLMNGQVGFKN